MISFKDLNHSAAKAELLYTHADEHTGATRSWAIQRLSDHLDKVKPEVKQASMDMERAEFFFNNRGIEQHRIEFLRKPDNWQALHKPTILMRSEDSNGEMTDLTLDGHHRYIVLALMGYPTFNFYHLSEADAAPFEVCDMPEFDMDVLVKSFSGIGVK